MNRGPSPLLGGIGRLISDVELHASVPDGPEDRFSGYGIWSLAFASGHVLALRRFPASSIGLAYTAVWLRDPSGRWTIFSDAQPEMSCARYAGRALHASVTTPIRLHWAGPGVLRVEIPGKLSWEIALESSRLTRSLTSLLRAVPSSAWRSRTIMRAVEWVGSFMVGGRVTMQGHMPNGHRFRVVPRALLSIARSHAVLDGADLGDVQLLETEPHLGTTRLSPSALLSVGDVWFQRDAARRGPALIATRIARTA